MLGDGEARLLADALNALAARDPAAEAETIELKQVHLSEPVRDQLTKAGTRAGVEVLLSRVNGQGLPKRISRSFGPWYCCKGWIVGITAT